MGSLAYQSRLPERYYRVKHPTREGTSGPGTLGQAIFGAVSKLSSSIFRSVGTHQRQPISARIYLGVLCDVPIRHPGTHDAKRK